MTDLDWSIQPPDMSVKRISLRVIASLEPGETVWDVSVKGFGVRRQRRTAVYVFKYRIRGRQRFLTIGRHGSPWNPDEARSIAKQYLSVLANKDRPYDPANGRDIALSRPTFAEFSDCYISRYAILQKKPRSVAEDKRNLRLHILPILGHMKMGEIGRCDVARFHTDKHIHPTSANRCLALISHIFTKAEQWGARDIGTNPCRGLEKYRERIRERVLGGDELGNLGFALKVASNGYPAVGYKQIPSANWPIRSTAEDWRAIACFRLLLFTGARLSEILSLRWSWIDCRKSCAYLPDSKSGAKVLTLPLPALDVLKLLEAKHRPKYPNSPFVLPSDRTNGHFSGIQKPWQRIRALAGLSDVRIHDLRHAFASTAVSEGASLYIVSAILGHRNMATTQRYAHLARGPIREVANLTAGKIATFLGGAIAE